MLTGFVSHSRSQVLTREEILQAGVAGKTGRGCLSLSKESVVISSSWQTEQNTAVIGW